MEYIFKDLMPRDWPLDMIRIDRLHTMVTMLEELHGDPTTHKRFHLRSWYSEPRLEETPKEVKCGTTACAVGWAGLLPVFQRQGFRLKVDCHHLAVPSFAGEENWMAVAEFFGIPTLVATYLFIDRGQRGWNTALGTAKRLKAFIEYATEPA